MGKLKWSELNNLQLGMCSESYAKIKFIAYGYDVFSSDVDDHGVDFVVKKRDEKEFFEVQVKSVCRSNYVFITKSKKDKKENKFIQTVADLEHYWVCLLRYIDEKEEPDIYVIPITEWNNKANEPALITREYGDGKKSNPEWGINFSKKYEDFFENFKIEKRL